MAQTITPWPWTESPIDTALERVRNGALGLAPEDGHSVALEPHVCIYRFSTPTTFRKAASFGITLIAVLDGEQRVRLGGRELAVDSSQLLVMTRELEFESAVVRATRERPYVGLGICFAPERVAQALVTVADAGATTTPEAVSSFALNRDASLTDTLARLLAAIPDPLERRVLAPLALDELLFRLLRSDAAAAVRSGVGQAADAQRILSTMQHIRSRYADKLTVARLAKLAAMSPSHFAHRFSAVARVSPMRYLREVRLERARVLLAAPGARVSEVAVEVGFESPAHFAREFKRRYGAPPSRSSAGS